MSNLNKSAELIEKLLDAQIDGSEKVIAKRYAKLLNEIRLELSKVFEQYEKDGVLTYSEMAKYDRLHKFLSTVNHLLSVNYKDVKTVVYGALESIYKEGYYRTAWAIETDSLSKLAYAAVTADVVTAMIENPISGLTLSQRLEKNRTNIIYTIQQEITRGLVEGNTYSTMAKRLKESIEVDASKAMRIVRTEAHRASQSGQLESAVEATKKGVVMLKEWGSMEDERVRHGKSNHRKLDGEKIPVNDLFDDGLSKGLAPGQLMGAKSASSNINCRCVLFYSIDKITKPDAKELEGMTFEQWEKERLKSSK